MARKSHVGEIGATDLDTVTKARATSKRHLEIVLPDHIAIVYKPPITNGS
jgi:hypothetical protein